MTIRADDILPDLLESAARLQILALCAMDAATFAATWHAWTNEAGVTQAGLFDEAALFAGKPGASALAFNTFAKVVAALAFVPGGVTVFNQHYEAQR